jgi:hypothetical protein
VSVRMVAMFGFIRMLLTSSSASALRHWEPE